MAQHGSAPAQKTAQHSPAQNLASTEICAGAGRSCAGLRCALGCAGNPALALHWRWAALALGCAVRWLRWRWAALGGPCAGAALALGCAGAGQGWLDWDGLGSWVPGPLAQYKQKSTKTDSKMLTLKFRTAISISIPVILQIIVWKFNKASNLPCEISA